MEGHHACADHEQATGGVIPKTIFQHSKEVRKVNHLHC